MKTPEEMAEEYANSTDSCDVDQEYAFAYKGFLAGYKAAQDRLLAQFKSLLSSFAETSFNPSHTAWQMFDILKDQVADVSKVMPQWISVKDRLPEEGEDVLVFGQYLNDIPKVLGVRACYRGNQEWKYIWEGSYEWIYTENDVTHWQPLPAPPKEEK